MFGIWNDNHKTSFLQAITKIIKIKYLITHNWTGGRSCIREHSACGCFTLTTNHKDFDIEFIKQHAKLIVDLRNIMDEGMENV